MKKYIQAFLKQACCIFLSLIVILPFYMVFINSLKDKGESAKMSLALPKQWLFSNYLEVIEKGKLVQGFTNSLTYAAVSTFIGVIACAMAAFVICRNRTKLNNFLYYFILCGLFFPSKLRNSGAGADLFPPEQYQKRHHHYFYQFHDSVLRFYDPKLCPVSSSGIG